MKTSLCLIALFNIGIAARAAEPPPRTHANVDRLKLERLAAVHADVEALRKLRVDVPPRPGLRDYRCIMHAHAADSTHTGGTLAEMLADAKKASVHAILLTDHYRPPNDFISDARRGMKEGVLLIPGSETHGFLVYPEKSIMHRMELKGGDFVNTVNVSEGMIFLSHIEERKGHPVDGLTGMEIDNRHYDAKRDPPSYLALMMAMTDPKSLKNLEEGLRTYPDEVLAFQCDYPKLYLDKWDESTPAKRLTGVAANDCHHNQILLAKMVDERTVLIGTNVDADDKMRSVTAALRPGIAEMTRGRKAGDVLAKLDFDPYYRSFRNACTHVIAPELSEAAIRAALKSGRAFVSHDWMGDASGFRFEAVDETGKPMATMGDEIRFAKGMRLSAKLPTPALVRLVRQGKVIATAEGKRDCEFAIEEGGVYRLEAFMKLDGEQRPWIFSNPIYIR